MRGNRSAASATPDLSAMAAICWIFAGIVYLLAETASASAFPNYSYGMNYISDLGVPDIETLGDRSIDSPLHALMNLAFLAHGFLFATAAVLMARARSAARASLKEGGSRPPLQEPIIACALGHALGMVLIAVVNGGQHNNELGLGWIHLLGAFLAFFGGHLTAICFGISLLKDRSSHLMRGRILGVISIVFGLIGILGIVMLQGDVRAVPGTLLPDGAWERIGMYAIIAWELAFGIALLARRRLTPLSDSPLTALH
ncbi:DUF998 domain-containing protein [Brevibacterium aurantiacum]|uniref:DUF998 domain-containing protein n=1 Tax=Brevibacterium aurantiacum TaxID=273384 RepID=A0A2A3ZAX9_BREAU|nr:hypothetical protein CIK62_13725 [Brevibacterium aurantiacum]